MLREIQDFLRARGGACLADIAAHLRADPDAVRPMLELLAARGRVRRVEAAPRDCGGCTRCDPAALQLWEWIADAP